MTSSRDPRLLVSAYQCGPGMGSVSQIGWEWYSRLCRRAPVTLVTHVRNREALEGAGTPLPGSEVVWIDTERFAGPLYRLASRIFPSSQHAVFLVSSVDFFVYDHCARRELRRRQADGAEWDLVHAVTPVSTVAPTGLHRLGAPLVLGPLNSGLRTPRGMRALLRRDSTWLYPVRHLGKVVDAWVGSTRRARAILTATRATRSDISRRHRAKCVPFLENGVDLERFRASAWPEPPSADQPLRALFVGRLVPFKAVGLLLEAVRRLRPRTPVPVEVTVVGEGPMRGEWEARARDLGVADAVRFTASLSLDRVAEEMRRAHVFCLPSVRESGGAVLIEAMASARPCIAVDHGGPGELVDDSVGRAIPPESPEQVASDIADALLDVIRSPDAWRRRGEEGHRRAETRWDWEAKVDAAMDLYRSLLGRPVRDLEGVEA